MSLFGSDSLVIATLRMGIFMGFAIVQLAAFAQLVVTGVDTKLLG